MVRVEIYFPQRTHWKVPQFARMVEAVEKGRYKARTREEKETHIASQADWMVMRGDFGNIEVKFKKGVKKYCSKTLGKILCRLSKAYTLTEIYDNPDKKSLVFEKGKE